MKLIPLACIACLLGTTFLRTVLRFCFYSWSYALPDAPAKLALKVYDDEMKLLWKRRYILPYRNETLFLYGCRVTNDGNAFILGEDYQGKVSSNMRIRMEKIKRFALFVEAGKKDFLEYTVGLGEDHVVSDMKFTMDKNNNLVAVGYYKPRKKYRLAGYFSYRINYETKKSETGSLSGDQGTIRGFFCLRR